MKSNTAVYWSIEGCTSRYELPHPDEALDYVAIHAAEIYYRDQDGWESKWPIIFSFYNESNELLGHQSVELDWEPAFSASDLTNDELENLDSP